MKAITVFVILGLSRFGFSATTHQAKDFLTIMKFNGGTLAIMTTVGSPKKIQDGDYRVTFEDTKVFVASAEQEELQGIRLNTISAFPYYHFKLSQDKSYVIFQDELYVNGLFVPLIESQIKCDQSKCSQKKSQCVLEQKVLAEKIPELSSLVERISKLKLNEDISIKDIEALSYFAIMGSQEASKYFTTRYFNKNHLVDGYSGEVNENTQKLIRDLKKMGCYKTKMVLK